MKKPLYLLTQISCQILYKYINSNDNKKIYYYKWLNINNYLMIC